MTYILKATHTANISLGECQKMVSKKEIEIKLHAYAVINVLVFLPSAGQNNPNGTLCVSMNVQGLYSVLQAAVSQGFGHTLFHLREKIYISMYIYLQMWRRNFIQY